LPRVSLHPVRSVPRMTRGMAKLIAVLPCLTSAADLVRAGSMHNKRKSSRQNGGNMLEVNIMVDDPDTFHRPWQTYQRYQRGRQPLVEFICAENNTNLFDYHMPVADKPDF
jgi:hypothetical protein